MIECTVLGLIVAMGVAGIKKFRKTQEKKNSSYLIGSNVSYQKLN